MKLGGLGVSGRSAWSTRNFSLDFRRIWSYQTSGKSIFMIFGNIGIQCTRNGLQNLPFCPGSPHNTFILFSSIFQNQISQTYFFKIEDLEIWKSQSLEKTRAGK